MTGLSRTDLTAADKVHLAAAAFTQQGQHGAITQLADRFGVSRPTVYSASQQVAQVLDLHFAPQTRPVRPILVQVDVDDRQLQRTLIALRAICPSSTWNAEDLLPLIYPGLTRSHGYVVNTLKDACGRAARFNRSTDLSPITNGALDEMHSQGRPVLAGVCLDTGYTFAAAKRHSRSGKDWADVLGQAKAQGLDLKRVVKDGAKGLATGVTEVFPACEQRDDCFHVHLYISRNLSRLERKGYAAMTAEEEAREELEAVRWAFQGNKRSLAQKLRQAKTRCQKVLMVHDQFAAAAQLVREGLEVVDLEQGKIRTVQQMKELLSAGAKAMKRSSDKGARKVGTYVQNRIEGLVLWAVQMHEGFDSLSEKYGFETVERCSQVWRLVLVLDNERDPFKRRQFNRRLIQMLTLLCKGAPEDGSVALEEVFKLMEKRHRASSAIEGFNAGLRPHLYVHKGVSQEFLELHRAYRNLRVRRWGKRKGTSAHQMVTGEMVEDWLSLLGYPPSSKPVRLKPAA